MEPVGTSVRRLGRYHLGEPLGGGPTGEVFRAKVYGVAGFEREFALRRFHPQLLGRPGARDQLRAAARLYAALEHPRIARLHEYDLDGPETYAAVEWVAGLDVSRLIDATFGQGQPLLAGAVTALISLAARAVGYAHGRGLAHLGLCPTNLICTRSGEVKVTDVGFLPARLGPKPELDETLAARIGYLAPEQLDGKATSPATDVFALGTIAFEMLTGKRAFSGRTAAELAAAVRGPPPDTSAIPKPIARVIDRCLAASPFARYPGGGALADAIDAATRGMLMRGDQRDAARLVSEALERLAAMHGDQVSGALSFPIPRPPNATPSAQGFGVPDLELDPHAPPSADDDIETNIRLSPSSSGLPMMPTAPAPRPASVPPPTPPPRKTTPGAAVAPPHRRAAHANLAPDPSPPTLSSDLLVELPGSSPSIPLGSLAGGPGSTSGGPGGQRAGPGRPHADPAITKPFVRAEPEPEPEPDYVRGRPSTFGESYLRNARPISPGGKVMAVLGFLALGAIGFFGYLIFFTERPGSAQTTADAAPPAVAAIDAAPPVDASPPDAPLPDKLAITSTPAGATVYLDGTKIGETPITIDSTPDQHKLALILAGYKLHVADIPGGGDIAVDLEEVTPSAGRAGIKVRCRSKNRYYVFIDGRDTGMLCPTERIGVTKEDHVVEIYDPITDTRSRFDVEITQISRSTRVRVD